MVGIKASKESLHSQLLYTCQLQETINNNFDQVMDTMTVGDNIKAISLLVEKQGQTDEKLPCLVQYQGVIKYNGSNRWPFPGLKYVIITSGYNFLLPLNLSSFTVWNCGNNNELISTLCKT